MTAPRFLQIHTLTSYTAALLNRDDSGLAKRLPYGGTLRTRISSQCLKRHWRLADDPHALAMIDGAEAAFRSRELVTIKVIGPLKGSIDDAVLTAIEPEFQMALYGDKGITKKSRQTLLFSETELGWLASEAARIAAEAAGDPKTAKSLAEAWRKAMGGNLKAMKAAATMPGGLTAALFGRMVTSDPEANIAAPVHVAHAITVHAEEAESDYFTAVDDLSGDEPGADTIQETELTSGLFYGYVVVDLPGLLANLGGDAVLAGQVLHNLIYLSAEVTPGAKLGSTAPYGRAGLMLLEAGDRQPRSLAEAFRTPCPPHLGPAATALSDQLARFDVAYATGEDRRVLSLANVAVPGATDGSLKDLALWGQALLSQGLGQTS